MDQRAYSNEYDIGVYQFLNFYNYFKRTSFTFIERKFSFLYLLFDVSMHNTNKKR